MGIQEVRPPGAPWHEGHPEGGGRDPVQREDLQKAALGYERVHYIKKQYCHYVFIATLLALSRWHRFY